MAQNEEQQLPLEASSLDPDLAHPIPTGNNAASAARDSRRDIYVGLGPSFTAIADREELERLYFSHFHPHWPLLDEDLFMSAPQMPELVVSILIAGLWMIPTREARREARRQHDTIMKDIERKLVRTHRLNPVERSCNNLTRLQCSSMSNPRIPFRVLRQTVYHISKHFSCRSLSPLTEALNSSLIP